MDSRAPRLASAVFVVTILAAIVTPQVQADSLYQTGFEAPQFAPNQTVDGQGGFAVTVGNPGAITVSAANPYAGSQSLLFNGGQLTDSGGGFYYGTAGVATNYDAVAGGNPVFTLESHVLLSGPSTNMGPGSGTAGDLVSVNMEAVLSDGSYFSTYLSSDGHAYGYTTSYDFSTPVSLDVYHDLKLVIDFANKDSTFYVDGQAFGTQAFDPSVTSTTVASAQFSMYAIDPPADRTQYTAQVDNFTASAVPEPSSLILGLIGLGGLASRINARRRAARAR